MMDVLKELAKQPYWIIALILGVVLVAFPCVTIDKDYHWTSHQPTTLLPVVVGIVLLVLSAVAFGYTLVLRRSPGAGGIAGGLDLTRVKEHEGELWTTVGGTEIRISEGRIEDQVADPGAAIALPCNEYFDDQCAGDTKSALGAYVNRVFEGQSAAFVSLMQEECRRRFGSGAEQQKTDDERAVSFGTGRCLLLMRPLGRSTPVALVSTTTQRAGHGLSARISYLFDGMREVVTRLADARLDEVIMPVLGAGHGSIDPPLAFVGLLLAVAEAARYGQGGQRLKRVKIVIFRRTSNAPPEVDPIVVRRALALIGSHG